MIWTPEEQRKKLLSKLSASMWAGGPDLTREEWAALNPLGCIGHCDPRLIDDKDERETNP
jgi:hypothetical protein